MPDDLGAAVEAAQDEAARKAALRRSTRVARADLGPDARTRRAADASARLAALPELRRVRSVLAYAATGHELDLADLLADLTTRRVAIHYPRVAGDHLEVVADTELRPGFRGVREPVGAAVDDGDLDAVLLPGLAFDPTGGRLGQGGGHYDRLLARLPERTLRVGVGFSCQLVPRVPRVAHDEPVDLVVTDRGTYRTGARTFDDEA